MRIDMIVDNNRLAEGMLSRIEHEVEKRVLSLYPNAIIRVRKGENNHLDIADKNKSAKDHVHELLEEMFNDADEWLYN